MRTKQHHNFNMPPKKKSKIDPPATAAPLGYHYEGEPARLINGVVTKLLRKDNDKIREDKYCDLYCCVVGASATEPALYYCAILGCNKHFSVYTDRKTGTVKFGNFFKHLVSNHQEYLTEADRNCEYADGFVPTIGNFFSPGRSGSGATAAAGGGTAEQTTTQEQQRFNASRGNRLREKLLQATVKVIAHGPYPICFLQNPAVKAFLIELDVCPPDFIFPSTSTVTRR